jgi:hypothetical protein
VVRDGAAWGWLASDARLSTPRTVPLVPPAPSAPVVQPGIPVNGLRFMIWGPGVAHLGPSYPDHENSSTQPFPPTGQALEYAALGPWSDDYGDRGVRAGMVTGHDPATTEITAGVGPDCDASTVKRYQDLGVAG